MDWGLVIQSVVSLGIIVQSTFVYKYLKKLNKSVDDMQSYMNSIKMGVTFLEQFVQAQDKDPNTESNTEKMVRYIKIAINSLGEFLSLQENEMLGPDEKNKKLKDFMIEQVKETIITYEGEDSELLNEDKILDMVNMLLNFIWPLIKPEASKDNINVEDLDVTEIDLKSLNKNNK